MENDNDALVTRGCAIVCAVDQELVIEPLSIELLPFSILMEDSCFIDENGVNFGYLMDNVDLSKQLEQQRKKEKRCTCQIISTNNNNNLNTPRESNLTKMLLRNDGEHYNKNVDSSSNGINTIRNRIKKAAKKIAIQSDMIDDSDTLLIS